MNTSLHQLVNTFFDQCNIIEDATVYSERISQYHTRYYGKDANLVIERSQRAFEAIDSYRSPYKSLPYQRDGYFNVDVEYYGLD